MNEIEKFQKFCTQGNVYVTQAFFLETIDLKNKMEKLRGNT